MASVAPLSASHVAPAPAALPVSLDLINSVAITGDQLIEAFAFAKGTGAKRLASLERFAASQRLKPPAVAAQALSLRMGLLESLMNDLGIVEGEWLATCNAVARIHLEDGNNLALPWGNSGVSYDQALFRGMVRAFDNK